MRVGALLESPNPVDEPPEWGLGETDDSPDVQQLFDWVPVVVVGVLVIGGLVAVGYFLDRSVAFKREITAAPLV